MSASQSYIKITSAGGGVDDWARRILLQLGEKGEALLTAIGDDVCLLFDAINEAKELGSLDLDVSIVRVGIVRRGDDKLPYISVAVKLKGGAQRG